MIGKLNIGILKTKAMITEKNVRELASRTGFSVMTIRTANKRQKYILKSEWEYDDGYRPSSLPLSSKEAWCYLLGFVAARYESL